MGRSMYGRRVIYSSEQIVTADNVLKILNDAMRVHKLNRSEISYLWDYCSILRGIAVKKKI